MKITRSDITAAFDDLLTSTRSRETIAQWASALLNACDDEILIFEPASERMALWEAIKYLVGVDLKRSPQEYLHNLDDFRMFRTKHGI